MKRPTLMLLALLLLPGLSSCRFNMYPVIPKSSQDAIALPVRISDLSIKREGQELVLKVKLVGNFEPGFLRINWFNSFDPVGQDSVYLDAALREATFRLPAPEKGAYRATLFFGNKVLRQVEFYEINP